MALASGYMGKGDTAEMLCLPEHDYQVPFKVRWLDDDWTYLNEKSAMRTYEVSYGVSPKPRTYTAPQRRVVRVFSNGMYGKYEYFVNTPDSVRVFMHEDFGLHCSVIEKYI